MLKPLVPKFGSDLSVRIGDIAEKQVPAKLKPIVGLIQKVHRYLWDEIVSKAID